MSLLSKPIDEFNARIAIYKEWLSRKILGENNERIDILIDSFHKLSQQQQKVTLILSGVGLFVFTFGLLGLYFSQMNALDRDLSRGYSALHELRIMKSEYQEVSSKFDKLVNTLTSKASSFRAAPFFEQQASQLGVNLQDIRDQKIPLPANSALAEKFDYVKIDLRLPNISIPRLLQFITDVERANHYVSLEDLKISGRFENKLYFDAQARFKSYKQQGG